MNGCKICEHEITLWKMRTKVSTTILFAWVLAMLMSPQWCKADVEPRLIVIGDSLSATASSWPVYMEAPVINLMAQIGRTARDYSPPRDLRPTHAGDRVVYFLGGNDIGMQSVHNGDPGPTRIVVLDHLRFLTGRGFRVLLVIPPDFGFDLLAQSNRKHRNMFAAIELPGVTTIDINEVWDTDRTLQYGIHPDPSLSYDMAKAIERMLY